jgi:hypothetical protein
MGVSMLNTENSVRERAYAIWEAAGRPHGRDKDHWFQAVRELSLPPIPVPGAITRLRQAAKAAARSTATRKGSA